MKNSQRFPEGSHKTGADKRQVAVHFVDCNTRNGRPKRAEHHFANRHAMLHRSGPNKQTRACRDDVQVHAVAQPSRSTLSTRNYLKPAFCQLWRSSEKSADEASDESATKRNDISDAAAGTSILHDSIVLFEPDPCRDSSLLADGLGSAYASDLSGFSDVLRWYQYTQPDTSTHQFNAARHHWADTCWDWIRLSKSFYFCMAMYTMIKKAKITGNVVARQYLEFKVRALQQIQADLASCRSVRERSMTLLAIGQMSFCELQDAHLSISASHLQILSAVSATHFMSEYEWLYLSWIDLRHALITEKMPTLPFYIPLAFQYPDDEASSADQLSWGRASRNIGSIPLSTSLSLVDAHDLLSQLHRICRSCDQWRGSYDIPFGQLYKLEHRLRTLDASLWAGDCSDPGHCISKIFIATAQLQTFVLTYAWLPVRSETLRCLLRRSVRLVHSYHENMVDWNMGTSMSFWLWANFTILALGLEIGENTNISRVAETIRSILHTSGIKRPSALAEILREWPLCTDWCEKKVTSLEKLLFCGGSCVLTSPDIDMTPTESCRTVRAAFRNNYVGAIEFYVRC